MVVAQTMQHGKGGDCRTFFLPSFLLTKSFFCINECTLGILQWIWFGKSMLYKYLFIEGCLVYDFLLFIIFFLIFLFLCLLFHVRNRESSSCQKNPKEIFICMDPLPMNLCLMLLKMRSCIMLFDFVIVIVRSLSLESLT